MSEQQVKRIARHLEKVESRRFNCSFDDLAHMLRAAGFTIRKSSGTSHVMFVRGTARLNIPYARPVKKCYVDEALAAVRSVLEDLQ